MSKRQQQTHNINTRSKRSKLEEIVTIKKIIVRNDDDPHVYANLPCNYVKIGDYVYKVKAYDHIWLKSNPDKFDASVSMTLTQYNDINSYVYDNKVTVSSYNVKDVLSIERLTISLSTDTNFKIITKREDITKYILNILKDHVVSIGQNFVMFYQGIIVNICINDADMMTMGLVCDETEIDFKYFDSNIVICNKCVTLGCKSVKVFITKCIDVNNSEMLLDESENTNTSKFPLIMDQKTLSTYARNAFSDTFTDNDSMLYTIGGIEYTFNIKVVGSNKLTKFKNTYELKKNDTETLQIQSNTENVIITDGRKLADKICFSVLPINIYKYDVEDYILVVDDIVNYFKKNIRTLTNKQVFKYHIKNKEVQLKINYINPHSGNDIMYELDPEHTKIDFDTETKSKFILVKNRVPYEVEKIVFKLKKPPVGGLFSFLMGDDNKSQMFDSKKLEKTVKNLFPKKTAVKHQMKFSYSGNDCIVVVKELNFKEKEAPTIGKKKYATLGLITDNTEFKFEISRNNKSFTINDTTKSDILKNPIAELEKYVGGISDELKKVVRTICLARGKLRDEFAARGLKAAKGIIFHGPPGTGKTTLARNLGKLLGCEGDRFRLMSGPEIFNKYVGESEANVRGIFKPAKEAWKKHGENAPMYMVVIDEIDAMLPSRAEGTGNPVRNSVVNQFLAEMDGLEQFNNLICVGITNKLDLLDPAAIRAGRFGTHIKIDLPDKKGRVKIFEIHTKKLKELNRLTGVNFDKLAELTDAFSGADIENIVELASTYSLERLNVIDNIDKDTIDKHGNITHEDFVKAIKEIRETNNKSSNDDKLHSMYI
ncbi:putative AAA family ATPase [Tupanvirus deep ocean]|uniref:AAA family ATPase n=2 Tax=Tupanvirus TaxID=2094720 RepID=A0AC62A8V8_9VIRU|nr:putative AAA family ATPase [Tupanvirus deep ocean]QKU34179.1 putative AAA family ATPase [Tupanvirus deep ocean]